MKKQTHQRLQTILLATITTIILFSAFASAFAQDAPKFKVGDRVKASGNAAPGTVVKIEPSEPGWLYVKFDDVSYVGEVLVEKCVLLDAKDKPVTNNNAAPPNETKQTDAKNERQDAPNVGGEFKVGDRVKVRTFSADENLRPCTITLGLASNRYGVRCDPWKTLSYMDYTVLPEWVFPWAGATAAPELECSFDAPAGTVSKTAAPSAQLFKRVIYDRFADDVRSKHGADVRFGVQFTTFQMGTPFKNVMTGHGLLRSSVPQNAMYYPVKAQFKECREVITGDYNSFRLTKENFGCYKDSFGDWVCGTDGGSEFLEQKDVPKKP